MHSTVRSAATIRRTLESLHRNITSWSFVASERSSEGVPDVPTRRIARIKVSVVNQEQELREIAPEKKSEMSRDSRVPEHLDTKSIVDKLSPSETHETVIFVK